jgi:hypothetical protein
MLSTRERNELVSKSGEKIVLGWNSGASESKALENWRNSGNQSGEKIGKNSGTPLADNTPFFPQLELQKKTTTAVVSVKKNLKKQETGQIAESESARGINKGKLGNAERSAGRNDITDISGVSKGRSDEAEEDDDGAGSLCGKQRKPRNQKKIKKNAEKAAARRQQREDERGEEDEKDGTATSEAADEEMSVEGGTWPISSEQFQASSSDEAEIPNATDARKGAVAMVVRTEGEEQEERQLAEGVEARKRAAAGGKNKEAAVNSHKSGKVSDWLTAENKGRGGRRPRGTESGGAGRQLFNGGSRDGTNSAAASSSEQYAPLMPDVRLNVDGKLSPSAMEEAEDEAEDENQEDGASPGAAVRHNKKAAVMRANKDLAKVFDRFSEEVRDKCYMEYQITELGCGDEEETEEMCASFSNETREKLREANGGGSLLLAGVDILSQNKIEEILWKAGAEQGKGGERTTRAAAKLMQGGGRKSNSAEAQPTGAAMAVRIGQLIDRKIVGVTEVMISGFNKAATRSDVLKECAFLAGANDLCIDLERLKIRLESTPKEGAWKVLGNEDCNHFSMAVSLRIASHFRCTPSAVSNSGHPFIMHRTGMLHTYANSKAYSNSFVIMPLLKGINWEIKEELYNPNVAAVFRVITQHEEEIALFCSSSTAGYKLWRTFPCTATRSSPCQWDTRQKGIFIMG